ncbi:PQQ-dependent sugar dehydrogenase [Eleftheria terrae]|uniref:PQQ-dependent sugar dehydrogenase n=1 Tax=Eleftheria terrae TaxID=1597781 RepID=UPI00263B899E|nr:sorbosone dehydrogenase family protein [Eleftheria terrae]WKB54628.1 sorbosone dehydrogenase family protein [Eleftheria terrae]
MIHTPLFPTARHALSLALLGLLALAGCGETARLPVSAGTGPQPQLPEPRRTLLPTVHIAPAKGWPAGGKPVAAEGLVVDRFADGLEHPRWLHVLPNGDVLVAETNAPPKPEGSGGGLRAWVMQRVMSKAGAGVPSANRITLLRDADGDGVAETRSAFLERLNSPFGMALVGQDVYVANTDAVLRFPYRDGETRITAPGTKLVDLPAGPRNHHWTKNLIASRDGTKLYVTTGSNSNVGENGLDEEVGRAAIWEVDLRSGQHRLFATGLRNPNGLAWQPDTGALWTAVNERDEIGSDLVPDYMTSVRDGGFYGWPYSYYGQHVDRRVEPQQPDLVARAIVPDYALGPHTASLGLAWSGGTSLPERFRSGMFIGQHGSWNRQPRSGYKVVFVAFQGGKPVGQPQDVLTGFLNDTGEAQGRPVGVALDKTGALLVADDVGNVVWRVRAGTAAAPASAPAASAAANPAAPQ